MIRADEYPAREPWWEQPPSRVLKGFVIAAYFVLAAVGGVDLVARIAGWLG